VCSADKLLGDIVTPIATVAASDAIYWVANNVPDVGALTVDRQVTKLAKGGGGPTPVIKLSAHVTAMGLNNDVVVVGTGSTVLFGDGRASQTAPESVTGFAQHVNGDLLVSSPTTIYDGTAGFAKFASVVAHAMAPGKDGLYIVSDAELDALPWGAPVPPKTIMAVPPPSPNPTMLRNVAGTLYAAVPQSLTAGPTSGSGYAFYVVDQGTATVIPGVGGAVVAFAVDEANLYVSSGPKITRYPLDGSKSANDLVTVGVGQASHVFVDATCLYYWVDDGTGHAALHVHAKVR
jgi:hypothetical protein